MSIIVKKPQKEGIKGVDFTKKGCYSQLQLKNSALSIKRTFYAKKGFFARFYELYFGGFCCF